MCYFINFTREFLHFRARNVRFGSYLKKLTSKHLAQNYVTTSCTTLSYKTEISRTCENREKPLLRGSSHFKLHSLEVSSLASSITNLPMTDKILINHAPYIFAGMIVFRQCLRCGAKRIYSEYARKNKKTNMLYFHNWMSSTSRRTAIT